MTYNSSIPQSTDLISNSQAQILANFGQLNTQYGSDHDGFNTGSGNGSGMHDQVTFLANQSAPSLTRNSVAGVSGLYVNTDGTNSQLFFQNAVGSVQLSGAFSAATPGYVTLPGGIVMQWKLVSIASTTGSWMFPVGYTTLYSVSIAPQQNATMWVSASSTTEITISRSGSGSSACWVTVIGK